MISEDRGLSPVVSMSSVTKVSRIDMAPTLPFHLASGEVRFHASASARLAGESSFAHVLRRGRQESERITIP